MSLVVVTVASACVNKDYDIKTKDIDMGAQIAPNGLEVLLGYFPQKYLSEVLKDVEDITWDDNKNLGMSLSDTKDFDYDGVEILNIDGIGNAFPDTKIDLDIPSFDFSAGTAIDPLTLPERLGSFPTELPGTIIISQTYDDITPISSNEGKIIIDVDLPEQIKEVETVWLTDKNSNPKGTPVVITFNLGSMPDFCSNVTIKSLTVDLPSRYTIASDVGTVTGSKLKIENQSLDLSNPSVSYTFYIEKLSLAGVSTAGGHISMNEPFEYKLDYKLTTEVGGTLGAVPTVKITGEPMFKDAEFWTNEIVVSESSKNEIKYKVTIPDVVTEVTGVNFKEGNNTVTVKVSDLGLPFDDDPNVKIEFPSVFKFAPDPNITGSTLIAPYSSFVAGYTLEFDKIELGGDGIPVGGQLDFEALGYEVTATVDHTYASTKFKWSEDIDGLTVNSKVDVKMDASDLSVETIGAKLNLSLDDEIGAIDPIDLSSITDELGDGDMKVNLIPPTITLIVENPTGIEIEGKLTLTPKKKDDTALTPVTANIKILGSDDGVTPKTTYIFIAEANEPFPADGKPYTRVTPTGYDKLLEVLPSSIDVKLEAGTDRGKEQLIAVNNSEPFVFVMNYGFNAPLAFRKGMDVAIEMTEGGLNSTFKDLANYGVKAEQIGATAELDISFPLQLGGTGDKKIKADFLDKDGGDITGLKTEVTGLVAGPGDGETGAKTSRLSIVISVPDGGDFAALKKIDQLRIRIPIDGTRTENYLNKDDTVGGRIYVSLPKGLNIDLKAIIDGKDDDNDDDDE